jgi:hypothetical protein
VQAIISDFIKKLRLMTYTKPLEAFKEARHINEAHALAYAARTLCALIVPFNVGREVCHRVALRHNGKWPFWIKIIFGFGGNNASRHLVDNL